MKIKKRFKCGYPDWTASFHHTGKKYSHMDSVIAVDLGATNLRIAIISPEGKISNYLEKPVGMVSSGNEITQEIIEMIEKIIKDRNIQVKAIGISTAGPVNLKKGTVIHSPNMKVDEISLRDPLEEKLKVPVCMVTDCKAGVYGEYFFGEAKGTKNLVYLTFSTGIGAGIIANGNLLQGKDGNAGEVGHIIVDTQYEVPCGCNRTGHWEAYSSGTGIPKFFSIWKKRKGIADSICHFQTSKEILSEAGKGNSLCREFAQEIKVMNARGLSSVVCAYNPEHIIVDGPIARGYFSLLFDKADSYLYSPKISISEYFASDDAVISRK